MNYKSKDLLCRELRLWMKGGGYTQEKLAKMVEISQAHLSKIVRPSYKSYSKSFITLCNYANIDLYNRTTYDPLLDEDLKNTLRVTIGNSPEKALMVNKLVRALGEVSWELH